MYPCPCLAPPPKFDVSKMHEKGSRESQTLVDDGSGKVEIWRIEDFKMVPLDEKLYGQFFGGDSYVILYTYIVNRKENYIIYFWQGQVLLIHPVCKLEPIPKDIYS